MRATLAAIFFLVPPTGCHKTNRPPATARAMPPDASRSACDEKLEAYTPGDEPVTREISTMTLPRERVTQRVEVPCDKPESDEACLERAMASRPDATVQDASISGKVVGWIGVIEVDGVDTEVRAASDLELTKRVRDLQAKGHKVTMKSGRREFAPEGRTAGLVLEVDGPEPPRVARMLRVRWTPSGSKSEAIARAQQRSGDAGLTITKYEQTAEGEFEMTLECDD